MKWLLIIIWYVGAASPDNITYQWARTKEECEDLFKAVDTVGSRFKNHVCIPFE